MIEFISNHIIGLGNNCDSEYIFENINISKGIFMMDFGYDDISIRLIKL